MSIYCCPEVAEREGTSILRGHTTQGLDPRDVAEGAYRLVPYTIPLVFKL